MTHKLSDLWTQLRTEKWLLLLCFILSFFAWQAIRYNIGSEVPISNIEVEIDTPEGWAVLERSLDTVDVRFLGSREDIRYLNREQLRVVVPILNPEQGRTIVIPLQDKYVKNNPAGTKVISFSSSQIEIRLDQEGEKILPVKATYDDAQLPAGVEIEGAVVCKPASVRIKGAQQQLDKMDNIHTLPIDLKNRQGDFRENVRIALPQTGRLVADPDRVTVEFTLKPLAFEKNIDTVPIHVLDNPGSPRIVHLSPAVTTIKVGGKQQRLEVLQPHDVMAFVDCSELKSTGEYTLELQVELPAGLYWIKPTNSVVNARIDNMN